MDIQTLAQYFEGISILVLNTHLMDGGTCGIYGTVHLEIIETA